MSEFRQETIAQNADWFKDNDGYMETQSKLEHYRHVKRIVERELRGVSNLLDIGNGGFFNYDTTLVGHATAVDLFLPNGPGPGPNTTFKAGSLLDLPCGEGSFDAVLLQNVFHHVTGRSVAENQKNLRRGMAEIHRCLSAGGKAIIIESTVRRWFYSVEKWAYRPLLALKKGGHPVTFQFTPAHLIKNAERAGLAVDEFTFVPKGAYVLQFGRKWPSALTPVTPVKLVLTRAA